MSKAFLEKAEDPLHKSTAHTRESGLAFAWVIALTDEFDYQTMQGEFDRWNYGERMVRL